jgi:hypothetical protein
MKNNDMFAYSCLAALALPTIQEQYKNLRGKSALLYPPLSSIWTRVERVPYR